MENTKPKLVIFASGSKTGGGSGFEKLVLAQREGILNADIAAVVSNHENGGVREKADRLGINFIHFPGPFTADAYQEILNKIGAEFVSLSGWLKLVAGLDPRKTFNIHPGPLPRFGGKGMYGHHVHKAVMDAYRKGEVKNSEITMHFVTPEYDKGPTFFKLPIEIFFDDTAETLGKRANEAEHKYQPYITDLIVNGKISWDGINPDSLQVPIGYKFI
ncbi:MAG: Phosphoribosylglycinamide formyltransferase [Candidatus Nomurabacteria bacterium GW2011_GWB1_37_5]|uniref:phosphoribosylglycinamide formyltransferase 1 n=1 Tax=Candidatus Nomurabacteria bacterium GW2011_GWB1_37_5 TaxID=1618742 RepID=A0A0G0H0Q1_9BACT|nr:MAG: Phosphoribosylglycinamide formyltransferase [Candidatus Nomurabacteria bacterium GW2011_GWB1_37_5]